MNLPRLWFPTSRKTIGLICKFISSDVGEVKASVDVEHHEVM